MQQCKYAFVQYVFQPPQERVAVREVFTSTSRALGICRVVVEREHNLLALGTGVSRSGSPQLVTHQQSSPPRGLTPKSAKIWLLLQRSAHTARSSRFWSRLPCGFEVGINTTTPAGKALFGMMGVFAEFEREMIRERVRAGMARVKATGKNPCELVTIGRPMVGSDVEE